MNNIRLKRLIESGNIPPHKGVYCLDCYNQKVLEEIHITITARYDDGNKFIMIIDD